MIKKRITLWYILRKTINFLVPDWLFNFLKKHPFLPLIIILLLYAGSSIIKHTDIFPIPCIGILGNDCIQQEQIEDQPFRGIY